MEKEHKQEGRVRAGNVGPLPMMFVALLLQPNEALPAKAFSHTKLK